MLPLRTRRRVELLCPTLPLRLRVVCCCLLRHRQAGVGVRAVGRLKRVLKHAAAAALLRGVAVGERQAAGAIYVGHHLPPAALCRFVVSVPGYEQAAAGLRTARRLPCTTAAAPVASRSSACAVRACSSACRLDGARKTMLAAVPSTAATARARRSVPPWRWRAACRSTLAIVQAAAESGSRRRRRRRVTTVDAAAPPPHAVSSTPAASAVRGARQKWRGGL